MTDEDVVRRAGAVSGVGRLTGPRTLPSGKQAWRWHVTKTEDAAGLAMTMYPLLGKRRQERVRTVLVAWRAAAVHRKYKLHCVHGHPLSGSNLLPNTGPHRRCRECARFREAQYRARKAGRL